MAVTWDAVYKEKPPGTQSPTLGDNRMRETRESIQERMTNAHYTVDDSQSTGSSATDWWHKMGSAKIWYQAAVPTVRVLGSSTGLSTITSDDNGRLWFDSDATTPSLFVWNGTDFTTEIVGPATFVDMAAQTVTGAKTWSGAAIFSSTVAITGATTFSADLIFDQTDPEIRGGDTDGVMYISPGVSNILGGSIRMYGDTHASKPDDIEFYGSATLQMQYDDSASTFNFQANALTTSGTITGIIAASNVTEISNLDASEGEQLEAIGATTISAGQWAYLGNMDQDVITSSTVTFGIGTVTNLLTAGDLNLSADNPEILGKDTDGALIISANTKVLGANIWLYGDTHATNAGDMIFQDDATLELHFDASTSIWDFQTNAITTSGVITGTIAASNVTEISALTEEEGTQLENIDSAVFTTQNWIDLQVYAENPLTQTELIELQAIGAEAISGTEWGYVAAMNQGVATTDTVSFSTVGATTFTGALTGNADTATTAGTVTTAAQGSITSLGTLTTLQVDNININGNTISSTAGTDLLITPLAGQQLLLDTVIIVDNGSMTGVTTFGFAGGTSFTAIQTGAAANDTIPTKGYIDDQIASVVAAGAVPATIVDVGIVTLATDAEAVAGTITTNKAINPGSLTARLAAPGAIGGTTPAAGTFGTLAIGGAPALHGFHFTSGNDENDVYDAVHAAIAATGLIPIWGMYASGTPTLAYINKIGGAGTVQFIDTGGSVVLTAQNTDSTALAGNLDFVTMAVI